MGTSINGKDFVRLAKAVHGKKYDYSKVDYINKSSMVTVVCKEHGPFTSSYKRHVYLRNGCPGCSKNRSLSTDYWIRLAKRVHGRKYVYSSVKYVNSSTKIDIACHKHGVFEQTPNSHLNGQGCPTCYRESKTDTIKNWVAKATAVHGHRYDYSESVYVNTRTKLSITCTVHGVFEQLPSNHLKYGCHACGMLSRFSSGVKRKEVAVGKHKFVLQGFEPQALTWILAQGVKPNQIKHGRDLPVIIYEYRSTLHKHYPDFWIPKINRIVEVKSLWTAGLYGKQHSFNRLVKKREAAIAAGFDYKVLLFDRGDRKLDLPKNWWTMKKKEVLEKLKGLSL